MLAVSKDKNSKNDLGNEKIGKLLLKFSIPAIIGMVVNMLYSVVDRIYIGNIPMVGDFAITGVGITAPITVIITGLGMLVGIGTSANISIALGSGDKEKAQKILNMGFVLTAVISIFIAVVGNIFANLIVELFGGRENTTEYALLYLRPLLTGSIFNLLAFSMNHSISSDGNPQISMMTMIIGATINIILDPIFIFGLNMGIQGAAYATVISQAFGAAWVILYFTRSKKANLHLKKSTFTLDKNLIKPILLVGMAPCLMQIASSFVQVISNNALLTYGGERAIGAMAVITSICSIFIMPIFGLNQGAQPIMGYNLGAKKYSRVRKTYLLSLIWCTIVLAVSYLVIFLTPEVCVGLFNDDPNSELSTIAINGIRLYLCMLPFIGIQMTASNYFQATGRAKFAMIIGLTRQVFFLVPALLILPQFFGLQGIWIAGPAADFLSVIVSSTIVIFEMKRLGKGVKMERKLEDERLNEILEGA